MTHTYAIDGMTCGSCAKTIENRLVQHPEITTASVSLEDHNALLLMNREIPIQELQELIAPDQKYRIIQADPPPMPLEQGIEEASSWTVYKPLLLVFTYLILVASIGAWSTEEGFDWMKWMRYFMGGFFIVFSFFKFLDLRGFADSYAMYDFLAKNVKAYGFIYPFIELVLGIALLTNFKPEFTYIATIIVMGFSSLGVIWSVFNKQEIRCACLGVVFNLPMSTVTIIEDGLMMVMAMFMLLSL